MAIGSKRIPDTQVPSTWYVCGDAGGIGLLTNAEQGKVSTYEKETMTNAFLRALWLVIRGQKGNFKIARRILQRHRNLITTLL
jgi:hypothetical protein